MSESITDAFKCNQCGATYDSEHDLKEHQRGSSRRQAVWERERCE
jgi:hypothetical protein